mgnify:CR=1 FL=1
MFPAREHLKAGNAAACQIDLLLEIGQKFIVDDAGAHRDFDLIAGL